MNESEIIQAIADIKEEARKNPAMSSEVSQGKILEVISYSALLFRTDREVEKSHTFQENINNVILPYVKTRDKDSTAVYNICRVVLEHWNKRVR
jgi:hypothetical protein